ncbi:PepSY domain-containing protein [Denitrobaculum tricleocarpae]|nr:PepSY domain-containing protein [Denitrobaculum tricleocarpae]
MRKLLILFGALSMILAGTAGAQAGDRHGGHNSSRHYSHSYHSSPYWAGAIFFGHHDRGHRAYDRRYDRRYGHHRSHRHYGHKHGYYDRHGYYKKHKHGHKFHKRRILPIKKIVKKLRHRNYHDISRIVLKHDRYRVRAYDRKGRPVKLVVNAHNGRILKKRYR